MRRSQTAHTATFLVDRYQHIVRSNNIAPGLDQDSYLLRGLTVAREQDETDRLHIAKERLLDLSENVTRAAEYSGEPFRHRADGRTTRQPSFRC